MNDENKQKVLDSLNHFRKTARSVNKIAIGVRDLQSYAKEKYQLKQQEVAFALDFLIDHGWVNKVTEERSINRGSAVIPTSSSKYKLSAQVSALYDSSSRFNTANRYSGISIENIGGVVVVGNNNIVNNKFKDLYTNLDSFEKNIKFSENLSEEQKLEAFADIQTIKDQLTKDAPNYSVIKTILSSLTIAADISGASDLLKKIVEYSQSIFI